MSSLALTPRGHLLFTVTDDALVPPTSVRGLERAFGRGSGHGLFELGATEVGTALPADLSYWRDFAARLVAVICTHPDLTSDHTPIPPPGVGELEALAAAAPPMTGAEYLTASVLQTLWVEAARAFRSELAESKASVQAFLQAKIPRGISSAASTSTWPKTGGTTRLPSPFWRPIRPGYRPRPKRSICRSAAR